MISGCWWILTGTHLLAAVLREVVGELCRFLVFVKCLPDKDVYRVFVLFVVLADISRLLWLRLQMVVCLHDAPVADLVAGEELSLSWSIRKHPRGPIYTGVLLLLWTCSCIYSAAGAHASSARPTLSINGWLLVLFEVSCD